MSKKLIFSLLGSLAVSLGGWMVSCGQGGGPSMDSSVIVQMPEGCSLDSPKDSLGGLTSGTPVIQAKPGKMHFVFDCEGRTVDIYREVKPGSHTITFTAEDVR